MKSQRGSHVSSNKGPCRSVVDYDTEEQLNHALLSTGAPQPQQPAVARSATTAAASTQEPPSAPGGGVDDDGKLDWVLNSYDADTTEAQSMLEELKRLQTLKTYLILDAEREEAFERITSVAARTFNVPISLVSLVDLGRQWFMSNRGLPEEVRETPRKYAFCAHAILSKQPASATPKGKDQQQQQQQGSAADSTITAESDQQTSPGQSERQQQQSEPVPPPILLLPRPMLVVPDATQDFRFKDNPLVTGPPNIRFYAGTPLVSPEGYKLGTLCIIDSKVRPAGLSIDERFILQDLAAMTVQVMVDRRNRIEHSTKNKYKNPAQLIAYTAHDLITPLTGVQISLQLLKDDADVKQILGPQRMELLSTAASCSDLMLRICQTAMKELRAQIAPIASAAIDDPVTSFVEGRLNNMNNNNNNNSNNNNNTTDLNAASNTEYSMPITRMDDLIRSLHMIIDPIQKKVPVIISLDKSVPSVIVGDDLKLFRCALNLFSNASSRTATGSIHLRIYPRSEQQQHDQIGQQMLIFECEDTGDDIDCDEYTTLFQPTVSASSRPSATLGLNSVASLVDSMDGEYGFRPRGIDVTGKVVVDSKGRQYQGAIFWFAIPLHIPDHNHNDRAVKSTTTTAEATTTAATTKASSIMLSQKRTSIGAENIAAGLVRNIGSTSSFSNLKKRATINVENPEQASAINESCLNSVFTTQLKQQPQQQEPSQRSLFASVASSSSAAAGQSVQQPNISNTKSSSSLWDLTPSESVVAVKSQEKNVNTNYLQSSLQQTAPQRPLASRYNNYNIGMVAAKTIRSSGEATTITTSTDASSSDVLPRTVTTAAATVGVPRAMDGTTREHRALVIDDSLVVRKSLARALNKIGYAHVAQAVDGMEGLNEMKKQLFDIVFCDFLMPVMDGLDCVKQYRAWEEQNRSWFKQLIIGISAHANMNDSGQGIQAGMDDFRPKPITIKTLTELQQSELCMARSKQLDAIEGGLKAPLTNSMDKLGSSVAISKIVERNTATAATTTTITNSNKILFHQGLEASDTKAPPSPKRPRQQTNVCLMVTDTPTMQSNQVLTSLEALGWKVVIVHEGKDALRLLQMRNWDAVLIDDDISAVHGQTCIAAFREWEEQNRVNGQKNIFLVCDGDIPSPYDTTATIQPPMGYNGVLKKPVSWKDLRYYLEQNGVDSGMDIVVRN